MPNFIPYHQRQPLLLPVDIEELIPEDHLVYVVDAIAERLDITSLYQKYKNSEGGRPCYHPRMLLKVLFYAYATGVRSSRQIAAKLESDVYFMYLAAMQRPDFRTISDFRKNHFPQLKELFNQIVFFCIQMDIARIGHIAIDGTKIRASAGRRRTICKEALEKMAAKIDKEIQELLKEVEKIDEQEDRVYGDTRGDEVPKELRTRKALKEKIEQAKVLLEEQGLKEINVTDPECRFMKDADGGKDTSYNSQVAADGENQVIVANDVTFEGTDQHQFIPMYEQVIENTGKKPEEVSADCGYYDGENYMYIEQNGIDAYIPDQMFEKETDEEGNIKISKFDRRNFTYNKEDDTYSCPAGKKLVSKRNYERNRVKYRVYIGKDCSLCEHREECTKTEARQIRISSADLVMEQMRKKLLTEEGKKKYNKRLSTVEPVFGNLKMNLGFRYFLVRGMEKVKGEFNLMCIAHNLKKIRRYVLSNNEEGGFQEFMKQYCVQYLSFFLNFPQIVSKNIRNIFFKTSNQQIKLCRNELNWSF